MPKCADPFPFGDCQICQDKATGIHYGVAACQGCKGFYKRSILKGVKYVCYTGGNCPIKPQTRSRCKACRFRRCVETGMSMGSIKMGRIPKAQKELALANLNGACDEEQASGDQCLEEMTEECSKNTIGHGASSGILPDPTRTGEELDMLKSTPSSFQRTHMNFVQPRLDCPALDSHLYQPCPNAGFGPVVGPGRHREYQDSHIRHAEQNVLNTTAADVNHLVEENRSNSWDKISDRRSVTTPGDNIHQGTTQSFQAECASTHACRSLLPKSSSPVHFSAELITGLINQVRQQPSSSRTGDMLTELFGNMCYCGVAGQHVSPTNQQLARPLQLTEVEMIHSTITKITLMETGLESDVVSMHDEIAGTLKPHRVNMLQEATQEDVLYVWNELFRSIPECTDKLIKYCRQFPGVSALGLSRMDHLIRKNYFQIWILQHSDLFLHGDFFLRFPGGGRYSSWWMNIILPKEVAEGMVNICNTLDYYRVPQLLRKIMCALVLFDSSSQDINSAGDIDSIHNHYLDVFREAVQNHYNIGDKTILLEMFKLIKNIESCAKKMAFAVGNYKLSELPDVSIQYLSDRAVKALDISSHKDEDLMPLNNVVQ